MEYDRHLETEMPEEKGAHAFEGEFCLAAITSWKLLLVILVEGSLLLIFLLCFRREGLRRSHSERLGMRFLSVCEGEGPKGIPLCLSYKPI